MSKNIEKKFNATVKVISPKKKIEYNPLICVNSFQVHQVFKGKEPVMFVNPFLPEGLAILAGKPKLGKSLFALSLALSIARGLKFLRIFRCEKSTVYYLPYEDNLFRISRRLKKMLGKMNAPKNLLMPVKAQNFPRLTNGGLDCLKKIIHERKDVGVIIIDTFGRFINKSNYGNMSFQEDYDLLYKLQSLAMSNHIAILLIHHTTKKDSEDPFDEMQGTMGTQASPDSLMIMKKKGDYTELYTRGRDFEEKSYSLAFDQKKLLWELKGDVREIGLSRPTAKILEIFKANMNRIYKPSEIQKLTKDTSVQNTGKKLKVLISHNLVIKDSRGLYKLNLENYPELNENEKNDIVEE